MFDAERTQKHCEGAPRAILCCSAAELRRYLETCCKMRSLQVLEVAGETRWSDQTATIANLIR